MSISVVVQPVTGMFWCTVATTCYEENERRDICLSCWMKTMKERNIEVLYNEEE